MNRHRTASLSSLLLVALLAWTPGCREKEAAAPLEPSVQATPDAVAPDDPAPATHRPIFYRIDGESGPVYLLGTIHAGFDANRELPQYVWDALKQSELFVMETDIAAAQVTMAARAAIGEGDDLKVMLGDESWRALDERLGGIADQFREVKPWFVVSMLTLKMLPQTSHQDPMDLVLHSWATKAGKDLAYLESPDYQIGVLEQTLTVDELKEMLEEYDKQKVELSSMLSYYRSGDVEQMSSILLKDKDVKPEMYKTLFYDRNEAWVPKIESYLERGNVFVAFGAGHLFGDRGVLALLKEKGHEATRLASAEEAAAAAKPK